MPVHERLVYGLQQIAPEGGAHQLGAVQDSSGAWSSIRWLNLARWVQRHAEEGEVSEALQTRGVGDRLNTLKILQAEQRFRLNVLAAVTSMMSIIAALCTIALFMRMKQKFRHMLIMLLIVGDLFRAVWYFVVSVNVFANGPLTTQDPLCQASGFFIQLFTEISDLAVLWIAIHAAMQILKPAPHIFGENGLQPHRKLVYTSTICLPLIMASLPFINGGTGYMAQGAFCTLPIRPFWYRLAFSWVPRYLVGTIILALAIAIYIHVGSEFKVIAMNAQDGDDSTVISDSHHRSQDLSRRLDSVAGTELSVEMDNFRSSAKRPGSPVDWKEIPLSEVRRSSTTLAGPASAGSSNTRRPSDQPTPPRRASDPALAVPARTYRPLAIGLDGVAADDFAFSQNDGQDVLTDHLNQLHARNPTDNNTINTDDHTDWATIKTANTHETAGTVPTRASTTNDLLGSGHTHTHLKRPSRASTAPSATRKPTFLHPFSRPSIASSHTGPTTIAQRRALIQRQLRLLFIYPVAYTLMWFIPFIYHCMQYNDRYALHPPYPIVVLTSFCLSGMGFVDSAIFCLREKPWRHVQPSGPDSLRARMIRFFSRERDAAQPMATTSGTRDLESALRQTQDKERRESLAVTSGVPRRESLEPHEHGKGLSKDWWDAEGKWDISPSEREA